MFHQKQFKNYCRCHAINNFLGYEAISYINFDKACDEFDKNNKNPNISKNMFYFYNNGGNDNIFGFIFKKLNYNCKLETFLNYNNKLNKYNFTTIKGFIIFNNHHTWCIRKFQNKYYLIDSLQIMVKPLNINELIKYLTTAKGIISIN